jgi:hypothetical protein
MSGRGSRRSGRGSGRGGSRGKRGSGREQINRTGGGAKATGDKKGMCAALGGHVFDHGDKAAADQFKTTWEKLTTHGSTLYGTDIGTELSTGIRFVIPKPQYSDAAIQAHVAAKADRKEMAELLRDAIAEEIDRIRNRIEVNQSKGNDVGSNPVLL